jgi:hypothetical protein
MNSSPRPEQYETCEDEGHCPRLSHERQHEKPGGHSETERRR